MVHRMLRELLRGEMTKERIARYEETLEEIARHCSEREIAAMEAERAADDLKKCEYMQSRIGTVETGIISGVAQYGFFVQLGNTVEGMVRVTSIAGDFYVCDAKNYRMVGRNSKRVFRLGDLVRVRVAGVDLKTATWTLNWSRVQTAAHPSQRTGRKNRRRRRRNRSRGGKQPSKRRRRAKNPGKVAKDPEK